ncbi:MAG: sulfatase-like hydrolase/transferase [Melioribacteraceae bacterium]|nr:sulfatase-like hydrolase/transferase [Melioribacteraceae bacterium]
MRRKSLLLLILLSFCLSFVSCVETTEKSLNKPNIIFFIADDMRPEHFNFLNTGDDKYLTPTIDRLSKEGTIMMNQHVVSPVCSPSRYNTLTGRFGSRATNKEFTDFTKEQEGQTCIQWNTFITDKDITLPMLLKKAGYQTGMVGKNHVFEVLSPQRFESYDVDPQDPVVMNQMKSNYKNVRDGILKYGFDYAEALYDNNPHFIGIDEMAVHNLDWVTDAGLKFIEQNNDDPFFLYFATTTPHGPSEAKRSWNADPLKTADGFLEDTIKTVPSRISIKERIEDAGIKSPNAENILWIDDALHALYTKLEEMGELDNTIIFFFSDHGQNAKGTLYQGGVYDPSLVWKKGGFQCGNINNTLVSNIDFAPTILDIANYKYDQNYFDGRSFLPSLEGSNSEIHESLYFELGFARGVRKGDYKYLAVRYPEYAMNWTVEERQKVLDEYNDARRFRKVNIVNEDPTKPFSHLEILPGGGDAEKESTGKYPAYYEADQLYNITEDPGELKNLAKEKKYQAKLKEMQTELKKYLENLPGKFEL